VYLRNIIFQNDVLCENNNLYLPTGVAAFAELRRNKHLDESRYRIGPPEVTQAKRFWRDVMWQLRHSCTTSDFQTNVASENHSGKLTTSGRLRGVMWQWSASAETTKFPCIGHLASITPGLSDVREFSWEFGSLFDIWRSKRNKHEEYSFLVCVLVLLGKEVKGTLCLHHKRRLHYSFVYKILAGQIAWKIENFFEEYEKCGWKKYTIE